MKNKSNGSNRSGFAPYVLALLAIGILTVVFIVVSSPSQAISSQELPQGVSLNASGFAANPAATATKLPPQALFVPTIVPTTPAPTATFAPETTATPQATVVNSIPTATPTPEPTATPIPTPAPEGIVPARLRIPSIGVDAKVEKVGQTKDGAMDVPKTIWDVAWYEPGAKPGELGSAVIDGHVDGPNTKAIFWDLKKLTPGQKIFVANGEGKELVFEVAEVETYPFDQAPLDKIFVSNDDIYLNLITCTGTFDQRSANYDKRLVVYSKLVREGQ